MTFLLDTNACIALIKGNPPSVRLAFNAALSGNHVVATSTISAFELWYGVAKSSASHRNKNAVKALLDAIEIVGFDAEDAVRAGRIRSDLRVRGLPIGPYDVLIAGTAVNRRATLVTANTREFSRVHGLALVNWQDELPSA